MKPGVTIFYDGACPCCTNYDVLFRLRENAGPVELVDARGGDPRVRTAFAQGYDLDTGFLVVYGGRDYYGADAAHILSLLCAPTGHVSVAVVNWLTATPGRARWAYPLLRAVRNLSLLVRGKPKIRTDLKL